MKAFLVCILLLTGILSGATAQLRQTRADDEHSSRVTGHGALVGKLTGFKGEMALLVGMQGGLTLNHRFFVGIGAYGLATSHQSSELGPDGKPARWNLNHGGLLIDYSFSPRKAVHVSLGALLGPGYIYKSEGGLDLDNDGDLDGRPFDQSWFASFEPHVSAQAKVLKWMRIGVGGSYRFARGVRTPGIADGQSSAPSANLTVQFGRF